jgi:hypothetical protein
LCSKWALSRYPELPPSSGVVPLGHVFTAAYVLVAAAFLYTLSGMKEEAETRFHTLVAYVFSTYIVFIIVAVVGMFVAYLLEALFLGGLSALESWHIVVVSIPILILLLVRAYSNFVNKHF